MLVFVRLVALIAKKAPTKAISQGGDLRSKYYLYELTGGATNSQATRRQVTWRLTKAVGVSAARARGACPCSATTTLLFLVVDTHKGV